MANFRRGAEAIQQAAARKGGGFTHNIAWKNSGEKKFIQFLSSIEEIPTVKFHSFIVVGHHEDTGNPQYRSFISRKDPGLDGADGYDPLVDVFGELPKEKCIAVAVELEPVYESGKGGTRQIKEFRVKTREYEDKDGVTHEVPAVGAIIQSPGIFFGWLSSYAEERGPIEDAVFSVIRKGKSTDTRYDFMEVGEALELDIPEEALVDLDAYLDELADEDRMRELVGGLDPSFVVNPYSKKAKGGGGGKSEKETPARRTRKPRATKQEAEPDPDDGGSGEDGDGEETPAPKARSSRFAQFKRDMASKEEGDGEDDPAE